MSCEPSMTPLRPVRRPLQESELRLPCAPARDPGDQRGFGRWNRLLDEWQGGLHHPPAPRGAEGEADVVALAVARGVLLQSFFRLKSRLLLAMIGIWQWISSWVVRGAVWGILCHVSRPFPRHIRCPLGGTMCYM